MISGYYPTDIKRKELFEDIKQYNVNVYRRNEFVSRVRVLLIKYYAESFRIALDDCKTNLKGLTDDMSHLNSNADYYVVGQGILYRGHGVTAINAARFAIALDTPLCSMLPPIVIPSAAEAKAAYDQCDALRTTCPNLTFSRFLQTRIEEEMYQQHMSQANLAALTGLSRASVGKLLNTCGNENKRGPYLTTLWLVANALHLPVDAFIA